MTEERTIRPLPGPGFLASCNVATWLDRGAPAGTLAWLLVGHPPPQRTGETAESIEGNLLGLAAALRLACPAQRVKVINDMLLMGGPITAIDYGHPAYRMRIPEPRPDWRAYVAAGGPVCVLVGLDPIQPGMATEGIAAYIQRAATTGRARMGITRVRGR